MPVELRILGCRFTLEQHDIDEPPANTVQKVGYVRFADSRTLKAAVWKRGQWVDHKGQPFPSTPVSWFSIEGPHAKASA